MIPKQVVTITGKNHESITIDFQTIVDLSGKSYSMLKGKLTNSDIKDLPQLQGIKLENESFQYSWVS